MSVVPQTTQATGIFQSDLLIKRGIEAGIAELRSSAWLQDYVMAGLVFDALTNDDYGQKTVDRFKEWFKATNIPVIINARLGEITATSVSINLGNSAEEENQLADVGPDPFQEDVQPDAQTPWPALTVPFVPKYNSATGLLNIPASIAIDLFPGMVIVDAFGKVYPILTVSDNNTCTIEAGLVPDFRNAVIKASSPTTTQTLESARFREQFVIGCHVNTEAEHLMFLHSVLMFILCRGRQVLFEARGFDRIALTSTDFLKGEEFERENIWRRYITVSGYCQHTWPKARFQKITGVSSQVQIIGGANLPSNAQPAKDQNWEGDLDSIGGG